MTSRWNIPNALSATRLLGVPLLFVLLDRAPASWFAAAYAILGLTDWLDGRLARAWGQTSAFGSMLDSVADAAFYISTAWFALRLFPAYVRPNLTYVVVAVGLFAVLVAVSLLRTRRLVLPHTHLSRVAGALAVSVFLASFAVDTTWAFRAVILLYALAFVEQVAMVGIHGDIPADTRTILWLRRARSSHARE